MRHRDFSKKIVWVLIVLFASGIMALLYFEDLEQKHNEAYLLEVMEQQKLEREAVVAEQKMKLTASVNTTLHEKMENIDVFGDSRTICGRKNRYIKFH